MGAPSWSTVAYLRFLHGSEASAEAVRTAVRRTFEITEPARDDLDATLDYRAVRDVVREVSSSHTYTLLESLAAAVADAIVARYALRSVTVRVRKPGIAWADWVAVSASRERSS